jgi:hypothetical protein
LDNFGVACLIGAHVFVCGFVEMAARVADSGVDNAGRAAEYGFHAPKAAGAECGNFLHDVPPLDGNANESPS